MGVPSTTVTAPAPALLAPVSLYAVSEHGKALWDDGSLAFDGSDWNVLAQMDVATNVWWSAEGIAARLLVGSQFAASEAAINPGKGWEEAAALEDQLAANIETTLADLVARGLVVRSA